MTHEEICSSAPETTPDGTASQSSGSYLLESDELTWPPIVAEFESNPHHDPDTETIMSDIGQHESLYTQARNMSGDWVVQVDERREDTEKTLVRPAVPMSKTKAVATQTTQDEFSGVSRPTKRARVTFHQFATQARLQQHQECKSTRLRRRKRTLERSIALSARLHRTSSWIRDGLVEIFKHNDEQVFARVYEHAHNLVDLCSSRWNHDLQTLETSDVNCNPESEAEFTAGFFEQLPTTAQSDLLDLLSTLRTKPQFLIDRLKALSPSQAATLNKYPRWEQSAEAASAFTHERVRSHRRKQRILGYAKDVEDYANSFERSNPLSLLLHNLYGTDPSVHTPESRLRLDVWSTICAELQNSASPSYNTLLSPVLSAFATIHGWPAKARMELFLMDFLQKGAFLLTDNTTPTSILGYDPFATERACEFFDQAMCDLFVALIESEGGFPTGAFALAKAILGKLPNEQQQNDFRGHFFVTWFLNHFLRIMVFYPENENMLLKVHISNKARNHLLLRLVEKAIERAENVLSNPDIFDDEFSNIVLIMSSSIEGDHTASNPYTAVFRAGSEQDTMDSGTTIVLCAAEIVKLLESLSRQTVYADATMNTMSSVFQGQYSTASNRYDTLKNELILVTEPGSSAQDIHPCMEKWTDFRVQSDGTLKPEKARNNRSTRDTVGNHTTFDIVQQAAARLCVSERTADGSDEVDLQLNWHEDDKICDLFQLRADRCRALTKTREEIYWRTAVRRLKQQYHLAKICVDDTEILRAPYDHINADSQALSNLNTALEASMLNLEKTHRQSRTTVEQFTTSLEQLRLKFYYSSRLVNHQSYVDARSVSSALNNMYMVQAVQPQSSPTRDGVFNRPSSRGSICSTPSRQADQDTIQILKAPAEHGGPRKLADIHITNAARWLQKNQIENFCTGEERIHRFCMEIRTLAQKFGAENTYESGDLWASRLFGRERSLYDHFSLTMNSAPASTRPASIRSDAGSGNYPFVKLPFRPSDSDVRSTLSDDRSYKRGSMYSMYSRTLNPSLLPSDLASSIGSYGRASSAPTNVSEIFSQAAPSITSYTAYSQSRPPSIYQDPLPFRTMSTSKEKIRFLENVQQGLICLLLSDLGSLVWSWGSETDSWVSKVQQVPAIATEMVRRLRTETLTGGSPIRLKSKRGYESSALSKSADNLGAELCEGVDSPFRSRSDEGDVDFVAALVDTMTRLSQHIDPLDKLNALEDFHHLIIEQMKYNTADLNPSSRSRHLDGDVRRQSLDSQLQNLSVSSFVELDQQEQGLRDSELTLHYRRQFMALHPSTMFRDLQYIAAFVPSEVLEKSLKGRAFPQFGVAALSYKTELCRSMVQVAAKRSSSLAGMSDPGGFKASDYWRIAAAENNAIAQRELAMLYLSNAESLPIFSMPMSLSSEVFKDSMMWQPPSYRNTNHQALCLALHWMQKASDNHDAVARQKLEQRTSATSIQ